MHLPPCWICARVYVFNTARSSICKWTQANLSPVLELSSSHPCLVHSLTFNDNARAWPLEDRVSLVFICSVYLLSTCVALDAVEKAASTVGTMLRTVVLRLL